MKASVILIAHSAIKRVLALLVIPFFQLQILLHARLTFPKKSLRHFCIQGFKC